MFEEGAEVAATERLVVTFVQSIERVALIQVAGCTITYIGR